MRWLLVSVIFLIKFISIESLNTTKFKPGQVFNYEPNLRERRQAELELSEHIRNVIEHFKQEDPVGVPKHFEGQIPDPIPIPDLQQDFSGTKMSFEGLKVHGLRRFRIEHVVSDLSALKTSMAVSIDELQVLGRYSLSSWLSRSKGNFNVTIIRVRAEADSFFMVDEGGFLQVQQINMDLTFEDIQMDFENLGFLGKIFQGMVNSIGTFIFDSIKPMVLQEVQGTLREGLNREARSVPQQFPNSINPLDMALASARNFIRERRLDPISLPNYKVTENWSHFELTDGLLYGLSTIHRTGSIILGFEQNSVQVTIHLGAENLKGKYTWTWGIFKNFVSKQGVMEFNVEFISAEVKLQQPANLDKLPSIDKVDFDIGNIAVLSDGAGTLDYIVEAIFNILPNAFRKQIIDSLEYPVCKAIEDELKKIDLEAMIEEVL